MCFYLVQEKILGSLLKTPRKDKVKIGLNLVIDLLSQCYKCYFWAEGEDLQGKSEQDVCTVDTFCSGNFVVKDFYFPCCQLSSHLDAH